MAAERNLILVVVTRVLACVVVLAIGVSAYLALALTRPVPAASEQSADLRRVVATEAIDMPVGRRWKAYGSAKAIDSADVPAQVAATIEALAPAYRTGVRVAKGELLLSLDDKDFVRQLSMAQEALASIDAQLALLDIDARSAESSITIVEQEAELAKVDVERAVQAKRDGAALDREVDRLRSASLLAERLLVAAREAREKIPARKMALKAERSRQESARDIARTGLDRCEVRSPLDGVLQIADKEVGEMAQPGMRVARVVGTDSVEIPLLLPASARLHLEVGNSALLRPDRIDANEVIARIVRISPEDDPMTRTLTVFAEADGSAGIAPGSFVEAEVSAAGTETRTVLPRRAVSGGRVLVIDEISPGETTGGHRAGRIRTHPVEIEFGITGLVESSGLPDTEWVVVRERLPKGTRLVLDASRQIAEGIAVEPIAPDSASVSKNGTRKDVVSNDTPMKGSVAR